MKPYKGNRYPFCCALFTEVDAPEAVAVLERLSRQKIRCAVPMRRRADCIARAAAVLLFLSPDAVRDKAVLKSIAKACSAGKPILTVYLRETRLTPGLSMQLGQMQAIPKYREESEEAFYEKLLSAPALQEMTVTPQQREALRRRTLFWAFGGAILLAAAVLVGLYWRPLKAMLPSSPLQKLGVPLDFDSIETLYVYGETKTGTYTMPKYRIYADGEHDWTALGDQLYPQGDITKLDDFAMLGNLKELCICNNPIESFAPIASLTGLTLLDVSHDQITDLSGIGRLKKLETLNVSYNSLSDLGEIAALSKLRVLNISYTDVLSLDALASMPALETVYIDAAQLAAAEALGETSISFVCLDKPIYHFPDLKAALNDSRVTDIRIMRTITVPRNEEITIRPGVVLTEGDGELSVSVYGTVRVDGVWETSCKQYIYGSVVVENGGVYTCKANATVHCGQFRIEKGGRHNLRDGATFTFIGGYYENNGEVSLQGEYHILYGIGGTLVNNGVLYLRAADFFASQFEIPNDKMINNGIVYVDGVAVLDGTQPSNEQNEPTDREENQTVE